MPTNLLLAGLIALQQGVISGVVRDSVRLEPVAFAQVKAVDGRGTLHQTRADELGAFALRVSGGPVRLTVTSLGFRTWRGTVPETGFTGLEVLLTPGPVDIEGVEVDLTPVDAGPLSARRDAFVIDSVLIGGLPKVLETDILRALTLSPAASAPSDFTAVPFVRGGAAEGTPVLLDGVRLFNPFHLAGFLSAVNAEAVSSVSLVPGGGAGSLSQGSLSGTMEVTTRDGSRDRTRYTGAIGLASSRLSVEGPLGESTSYLLDGRRTYIDGLTGALEALGAVGDRVPYSFTDLHGKLTRDLSGVGRLSLTLYRNREGFGDLDTDDATDLASDWSNTAAALHYRRSVGTRGILDLTAGHSSFSADLRAAETADPGAVRLDSRGSMSETRVDARLGWEAGRARVSFGAQARRFQASYDIDVADPEFLDFSPEFELEADRTRLSSFAELRLRPAASLELSAGARVDRFSEVGTEVSPSLGATLAIGDWHLDLAASHSRQALYSLRNEESKYASFLAYDLLVPVKTGERPLRNREVSLSAQGRLGPLPMRATAYVRKFDGLRLPPLGSTPLDAPALGAPEDRRPAEGLIKGLEVSASVGGERANLVGAYRWSSATRTVAGDEYVPRFHRSHELELSGTLRRGASALSMRLSARSGQPFTAVSAVVPSFVPAPPDGPPGRFGPPLVAGGQYNAARLPSYVRLDLGWRTESRRTVFGRPGVFVPYVAVLNVLNAKNVLSAEVDASTLRPTLDFSPQLPILPFFGLEVRF